jgi:hypothetical protein
MITEQRPARPFIGQIAQLNVLLGLVSRMMECPVPAAMLPVSVAALGPNPHIVLLVADTGKTTNVWTIVRSLKSTVRLVDSSYPIQTVAIPIYGDACGNVQEI